MHGDSNPIFFLCFGIVAILVIYWAVTLQSRSRAALQRWASEQGYEILRCDFEPIGHPFFWKSRAQVVFYIKVRDAQGTERSAWVKLGDWFFGTHETEVDVKWEDQPIESIDP